MKRSGYTHSHSTHACLQGTGSDEEMGIEERQQLAVEGIVVAAVDVVRGVAAGGPPQDPSSSSANVSSAAKPSQLRAQIRVTTRAMWIDNGRLLEVLHKVGVCAPHPPCLLLPCTQPCAGSFPPLPCAPGLRSFEVPKQGFLSLSVIKKHTFPCHHLLCIWHALPSVLPPARPLLADVVPLSQP